MKTILKLISVMLAATLLQYTAGAQQHLPFKGIPITGTIESVVENLKNMGFIRMKTQTLTMSPLLSGTYAGREAVIAVNGTPTTATAYNIRVILLHLRDRQTAVKKYNSLKDSMTKKYGIPLLTKPEKPENDSQEAIFYALDEKGRCLGQITLSIQNTGPNKSVVMDYTDESGSILFEQEENIITDKDI